MAGMNQLQRDAYQIAENTPRNLHDFGCMAPGAGGVIGGWDGHPAPTLCTCSILERAKTHAARINPDLTWEGV